ERDAVEIGDVLAAAPPLEPRVGRDVTEVDRRPAVDDAHPHTRGEQVLRHRDAGPPVPDHEHRASAVLVVDGYHRQRSFNVESAMSAQMIDTIQNRTMMSGSGHPFSS